MSEQKVEQRCENCKFFKVETMPDVLTLSSISSLSRFSRPPVVEGICRAKYIGLNQSPQLNLETKNFKVLSVDLCSTLDDQNQYLFQENRVW